jgi:DNA-directed RNA polymerase alpha subunit
MSNDPLIITPMTLVRDLPFKARAANCLLYHYPEIKTVWQLAELDPRELLRTPNFGSKSVKEIEDVLSLCGLFFMHHEKGVVFQQASVKHTSPWFPFCF